jgi:SAM-dependent methyltransferase
VIGNLLKDLWKALGIFLRYHLSRLFGLAAPRAPESANDPGQKAAAMPTVRLDPLYLRPIVWRSKRSDLSASGTTSNPIYQLWRELPLSHKWTHYFDIYQTIFHSRRDAPMRILEIGVLNGASLRLWKKYFQHPDTSMVGIDIDPMCARYDAPADGIHVRIGSQADSEFLTRVVDEFGPFDLIIDDGSHHSTHIITSFNCLYATGLKDDGIYVVEDIHANYWLPWRDSANSFLDLCKELVELMHAHYWRTTLDAWQVEFESGSSLRLEVPEITTMIKEIRFFDSIVAIFKTRRAHPPRYLVS